MDECTEIQDDKMTENTIPSALVESDPLRAKVVKILADTTDGRLTEAGYQNHILSSALHSVRTKNSALLQELAQLSADKNNLTHLVKSQTQYLHAISAQKDSAAQEVMHLRSQVHALVSEKSMLVQENERLKVLAQSPPPPSQQYARLEGDFRQLLSKYYSVAKEASVLRDELERISAVRCPGIGPQPFPTGNGMPSDNGAPNDCPECAQTQGQVTQVVRSTVPSYSTPLSSPQAVANEMAPYYNFAARSDTASHPTPTLTSPTNTLFAGDLPFAPAHAQGFPVAGPSRTPSATDTMPTDAHPDYSPPAVASTSLSPQLEGVGMPTHNGVVINTSFNGGGEPQTEVGPPHEGGQAFTLPDLGTRDGEGEVESNESEEDSDEEVEFDADGLRSLESCVGKIFNVPENEAGERPCMICNARYIEGLLPVAPLPFIRPSFEDLLNHCQTEHDVAWKILRR